MPWWGLKWWLMAMLLMFAAVTKDENEAPGVCSLALFISEVGLLWPRTQYELQALGVYRHGGGHLLSLGWTLLLVHLLRTDYKSRRVLFEFIISRNTLGQMILLVLQDTCLWMDSWCPCWYQTGGGPTSTSIIMGMRALLMLLWGRTNIKHLGFCFQEDGLGSFSGLPLTVDNAEGWIQCNHSDKTI